jgi:dTDP-4-dehydrorhamnose 3,5-epimerase-like enzyme
MTDRFEDERGYIQDLIVQTFDSVTEIFTRKGAVRGNHVHNETTQWTYIVSGKLCMVQRTADGDQFMYVGPDILVCEPAGFPHAWQAIEDTTVLVFTRGPRSGADYESDTRRLAPEDWLIQP